MKVCDDGFRVVEEKFLLKELAQKHKLGGLLFTLIAISLQGCPFMLTSTAFLLSSTLLCLCPLSTIPGTPGRLVGLPPDFFAPLKSENVGGELIPLHP